MTTEVERRPSPAIPTYAGPPIWSRIYGFGSVFGKTMRDSRRAVLAVSLVMGLTLIGVSNAIVTEFNTPESREGLVKIVDAVPPILQGLAGRPENVGTLGGYLQYKYGTFFPLIVSLWSILALSSTLAAEARRGSMEFVSATGLSRRRIALEKLLGHFAGLTIASLVVFVSLWITGRTVQGLPGDEIPVSAAVGYATWLGLLSIASGALAFALAPFIGRGSAAGVAGAVMFGGFIINGYQAAVPALAPLANLTWWGWTVNHIPLAGLFDWASLLPIVVVTIVLLVIGVEAFARRDIGATSPIPTPSLPRALVGLRGPTGRAFGHGLPSAIAWGLGIGLFGFAIAGSGGSFIEELGSSPEFVQLLSTIFPGFDIASVGGFLQLLFVEFGMILVGLAAATLVAAWASDETSGRLEFLLATPLSRVRWATSGGAAMIVAILVVTVLAAIGIANRGGNRRKRDRDAGGRVARPRALRHRHGRRRRRGRRPGRHELRGAGCGGPRDRDLVRRPDRPGARAAGRAAGARPHVPLRVHDARSMGRRRDRGLDRPRDRRHHIRGVGVWPAGPPKLT